MSPSDQSSWGPPRPGNQPPPPPPVRSAPPPPPPSVLPPHQQNHGYGAPRVVVSPAQPPRPATPVGGWLMVVGAMLAGVGCFLPWLSNGDTSINGFDEGPDDVALGGGVMFFALVLLGMGITTLAAKRILAIAIVGIVTAALCLLAAAAQLADYSDFADLTGIDLGPGLPVIVVGSLLALAGAIVTCAKRRRWPPATVTGATNVR